MGIRTKDPINVKTPSAKVCVESYFSEENLTALAEMEKAADESTNPLVHEFVDEILDQVESTAVDYTQRYGRYLKNAYDAMWDDAAFYTGNFRASIKMYGDFSSDPLGCTLDFDEEWFTTPKVLPSLKDRKIRLHREWETKHDGTHSNDYEYTIPAGTNINITGEDYRPRVPPPFVMKVLDEIDNIERDKAGVD